MGAAPHILWLRVLDYVVAKGMENKLHIHI